MPKRLILYTPLRIPYKNGAPLPVQTFSSKRMKLITGYLDTILVPLSLFLTLGYHAYLWHIYKNKPALTTIGANALRRRDWLMGLKEGDDKMGMLAVQSLRNTLMAAILTASVSILVNLALGALASNAYDARHVFDRLFLGLQSGKIFALKYGSASLFVSVSFLSTSMALGYLIDANFLINAVASGESSCSSSRRHTQALFERGFTLAVVGNRALCIAFPLLLWMFGAVPVALGSVGLVWGLYELDFGGNLMISKKYGGKL